MDISQSAVAQDIEGAIKYKGRKPPICRVLVDIFCVALQEGHQAKHIQDKGKCEPMDESHDRASGFYVFIICLVAVAEHLGERMRRGCEERRGS